MLKSPQECPFFDTIIVGAGAAGLMCALQAGQRGKRVLVLDKADKPGRKILISGGGRCNFTNLYVSPEHYLSANPHFCKSALARYTQWDFISLMEENGLSWEEKKLGQLFCSQRAPAVVDMLLRLCDEAGVIIQTRTDIQSIEKDNTFHLSTANDEQFSCQSLVIATGGPSIPRMGATAFGVEIAQQFGIDTLPFRPALVPLLLPQEINHNPFHGLAGVSLEVVASCNDQSFRENLLITHRGISGPAVLQISSYWRSGDSIELNLLPDVQPQNLAETLRRDSPDLLLHNALAQYLPRKLARQLVEIYFEDQPLRRWRSNELADIISRLQSLPVAPTGSEGLRTAEVCLGGVDTRVLSSKTMQSLQVPGLYFIGETVDVSGHLGGFNFQWAWSSGWCAGQYV